MLVWRSPVLALLPGGALWLSESILVAAYTSDPVVPRRRALADWFMSLSIRSSMRSRPSRLFALRGYRSPSLPMLYIFCFWGVGLFGGWWLAFRNEGADGVAGFCAASLVSLVLAALAVWRPSVVASRARKTLNFSPASDGQSDRRVVKFAVSDRGR